MSLAKTLLGPFLGHLFKPHFLHFPSFLYNFRLQGQSTHFASVYCITCPLFKQNLKEPPICDLIIERDYETIAMPPDINLINFFFKVKSTAPHLGMPPFGHPFTPK